MSETPQLLNVTDGPLGGLPPADKTLLASAPLEVAICEVRFTSITAVTVAAAEVVTRAGEQKF